MSTDAELERIVLVTMDGEHASMTMGEIRSLLGGLESLPDVLDALSEQGLISRRSVRGRRETFSVTSKGRVESRRIMRRWPPLKQARS